MKKKTISPEKQALLEEKARQRTERQRLAAEARTERARRSAEAMAQGPDVYAKRIIASSLQVPFIHFWYSLFYIVFDYIFGGHIIVKTWQKALIKAGYISEGALGVAGLWALANHVLHSYLAANPVTNSVIDPLNAFTMAAFTLIPDLILASAILVTINRYKSWISKEEKVAWLWALAYTLPTIIFACLTAYTLSTVSSLAGGGDASKVIYASGTELQIRVLSAYFYGLIEILFAFTHKGATHGFQALTPQQPPVDVNAINQALADQAAKQQEALHDLAEQHRQDMDNFNQRQEQQHNLQQIELQHLRSQVQQTSVATIDPNAVADDVAEIVLQRLDQHIHNLLQQRTRVAEIDPNTVATIVLQQLGPQVRDLVQQATAQLPAAPKQALLDAPKGRQRATQATQEESNTPDQQDQQKSDTASATGKTAYILDLLDKDPSLKVPDLVRLANCDRTLAWRARDRWEKAHRVTRNTIIIESDATESDAALQPEESPVLV